MITLSIFVFGNTTSSAEQWADDLSIPIQTEKNVKFKSESDNKYCVLSFDARVDAVYSGFSAALSIAVNGTKIDGSRLINKPLSFICANGTNLAWFRQDGGEWGWVLLYADSFSNLEDPQNPFGGAGISLVHFEIDISDLVINNNELTFKNLYSESVQREVGGKVPVIIRNLKVTFPDKIERVQEKVIILPPVAEGVARSNWDVNYTCAIQNNGSIKIGIGSKEIIITSYFSYPHGGWNGFTAEGKEPEPQWKIKVDAMSVSGEGQYYEITRVIKRFDTHISVWDTFSNKTSTDIGILVSHQTKNIDPTNTHTYAAGNKVTVTDGIGGIPENPTLFIGGDNVGLGLVAIDDVFRNHHECFIKGGQAGIQDRHLILAAQSKYTNQWDIYPNENNDYFTFINKVRRDWGLNDCLAPGNNDCFLWGLGCNASDAQISAALKGVSPEYKYLLVSPPADANGIIQYGYPMSVLSKQQIETYQRIIQELKRAVCSDVKILGYYGPPTFSVNPKTEELFGDSLITDRSGHKVVYLNEYRLLAPEKDSKFSMMITTIVDNWLDWGADGIYFDYFDSSVGEATVTFNKWDGFSGDIDENAKTITAKYSYIDLLSCQFMAELTKHIQERGGVILANKSSTTQTSTNATRNVPRLAECTTLNELAYAQLSPCPSGFQRTHFKNVHDQLLAALDYGLLTYLYDAKYGFADNPSVGMFPIKVMEIQEGYVIGENKIITKRSGNFGWVGNANIVCHLYDREGHKISNNFSIKKTGNMTLISILLEPKQVSIVERVN